jgi:Zn-dependent protease
MDKLVGFYYEYIYELLYIIPAVLISLTVHEYSHAFIATKLGDPTPRYEKRLSLNPIRHIDPLGALVMIVAKFGWAKPVHINPMYFKDPSKGMMLTAIAGPISNLILCFISSFLWVLCAFLGTVFAIPGYLIGFFQMMTMLNITLAVFNLIPITPLDGSRILTHYFPRYATFMAQYGNVIHIVFIALLILPDYIGIPDIFGFLIGGTQFFVTEALLKFWMLIFGIFL